MRIAGRDFHNSAISANGLLLDSETFLKVITACPHSLLSRLVCSLPALQLKPETYWVYWNSRKEKDLLLNDPKSQNRLHQPGYQNIPAQKISGEKK